MEGSNAAEDKSLREIFSNQPKYFHTLWVGMTLLICSLPVAFINETVGKRIFIAGLFLCGGSVIMAVLRHQDKPAQAESDE